MIADVRIPFISPRIPPERVADAIVRAVLKQKAEVLVPRLGAQALILANALSPGIADRRVRGLRRGSGRSDRGSLRLPTVTLGRRSLRRPRRVT